MVLLLLSSNGPLLLSLGEDQAESCYLKFLTSCEECLKGLMDEHRKLLIELLQSQELPFYNVLDHSFDISIPSATSKGTL